MPRPRASQSRSRKGRGWRTRRDSWFLFDISFSSFVTAKVVKVLYVLIMILLVRRELLVAVAAFRLSPVFGIITLFILCPVFFIVDLALWRIVLEIFVVVFRIAEDLRAIRARRSPPRQCRTSRNQRLTCVGYRMLGQRTRTGPACGDDVVPLAYRASGSRVRDRSSAATRHRRWGLLVPSG